jgi:hypothetical protein
LLDQETMTAQHCGHLVVCIFVLVIGIDKGILVLSSCWTYQSSSARMGSRPKSRCKRPRRKRATVHDEG